MDKIDFLVTWLDSSDLERQKQLATFSPKTKGDLSKARFRDMNIFKYWSRAVEKYALHDTNVYSICLHDTTRMTILFLSIPSCQHY